MLPRHLRDGSHASARNSAASGSDAHFLIHTIRNRRELETSIPRRYHEVLEWYSFRPVLELSPPFAVLLNHESNVYPPVGQDPTDAAVRE
jgi:hypothetical protein